MPFGPPGLWALCLVMSRISFAWDSRPQKQKATQIGRLSARCGTYLFRRRDAAALCMGLQSFIGITSCQWDSKVMGDLAQ